MDYMEKRDVKQKLLGKLMQPNTKKMESIYGIVASFMGERGGVKVQSNTPLDIHMELQIKQWRVFIFSYSISFPNLILSEENT